MKQDGTLRLCVDYHKFNPVTLFQQKLMPIFEASWSAAWRVLAFGLAAAPHLQN